MRRKTRDLGHNGKGLSISVGGAWVVTFLFLKSPVPSNRFDLILWSTFEDSRQHPRPVGILLGLGIPTRVIRTWFVFLGGRFGILQGRR